MRRLLLLRHAKAANDSGGGDSERPLTERGLRDATLMGRYLAREGFAPDTAVVSSARRTRETLDAVRHELPGAMTVFVEPRLYLAEAPTLMDHLRRTPETTQTLLAIGHNPGYQDLAIALSGSGDLAIRRDMLHKFPTCALTIIEFDCDWAKVKTGAGRLIRFVVPAQLRGRPDAD